MPWYHQVWLRLMPAMVMAMQVFMSVRFGYVDLKSP